MSEDEEEGRRLVRDAAAWAGMAISSHQGRQLARYAEWLRTEAIPAGVLGPGEGDRIWGRHIGDSLVFALAWHEVEVHTLLDVGTGAGLPGIPLAVAMPEVAVTLLDRSASRARLVARAARILRLENVAVTTDQVSSHGGAYDVMVSRATLQLHEAAAAVLHLAPEGIGVVALSRRLPPDEAELRQLEEQYPLNFAVIEVPPDLLDSPVWLLRMSPPWSAN